MSEQKTLLIADFDKGGRKGTEIALWDFDHVNILSAKTAEEALAIIEGEQTPDLVVVDPMNDIRFNKPIERNEGSFGVMTNAVARGVKVLIITSIPESVERKLEELEMQNSHEGIVQKGTGAYDGIREAVSKVLGD